MLAEEDEDKAHYEQKHQKDICANGAEKFLQQIEKEVFVVMIVANAIATPEGQFAKPPLWFR